MTDLVNHPPHYTSHPSGLECIQVTELLGSLAGNVVKYLWRADDKGAVIQDLEKARWYVRREIDLLSTGLRFSISVYAYQKAWEYICKWERCEPESPRREAAVRVVRAQAQTAELAIASLEEASDLITAEIELRTAA